MADTGQKSNGRWGIRTHDPLIKSQLGKSPKPLSNQQLTASQKDDCTNTGRNRNDTSSEDPELAKLIEVWPKLSDEMRKAIIKMTS